MKIGIVGYGNLGRGVECAVKENPDTELVAVFTRRNPATVKIQTAGVPVLHVDDAKNWVGKIDVMILCGGSATDLPTQTPEFAKMFNVIDSFDTHAKIPQHFANVDAAAKASNHVAIISVGWDPGLFSLARAYFNAILPDGKDYTFWGKGVSQGHSDAIRRVKGVKKIPTSLPAKNICANATSCLRKVQTPPKSKTRLKPCRIISRTTIQSSTSSAKRNCRPNTQGLLMAAS